MFMFSCVFVFTFFGLFSFGLGFLYFYIVRDSMLGSLRSVAQTVSYEVSLALVLMSFSFLICSLNLLAFMSHQSGVWFFMFTNRTPFDFAEGESELVSGFNVEYSSGGFALIFLAEYSSILFMSLLCCVLFLDCFIIILFMLGMMSFLWVWVRETLPLFRYDKSNVFGVKEVSSNFIELYMYILEE